MLDANDIRATRFSSGMNGYKKSEVDAFLDETTKTVETLYQENSELVRKLQILADKVEEYRKDEENIQSALLVAQRAGEKIVTEAQQKADSIVADATERGDEALKRAEEKVLVVVNDSKLKASAILTEAEQQAQEKKSQYAQEIAALEEELAALKNEVADFRANLLQMYKEHLEQINRIPNERPAPAPEPEDEEIPAEETEETVQQATEEFAPEPIEEPVEEPEQIEESELIEEPAVQEYAQEAPAEESPVMQVPAEEIAEEFPVVEAPLAEEEEVLLAQPFEDSEELPRSRNDDVLERFVSPPQKKEPFVVTLPEEAEQDNTTDGQLSIDLGSVKFGDDYSVEEEEEEDPGFNDGRSLFSRRKK